MDQPTCPSKCTSVLLTNKKSARRSGLSSVSLSISSFYLIVIIFLFCVFLTPVKSQGLLTTCHYSCTHCTSIEYYKCDICDTNRGQFNQSSSQFEPIYGMCYCENQNDQDQDGNCQTTAQYNYNSKGLITAFIALCLIFSLLMTVFRGMRYYLLKTIEDVQEISLIVFINLYFPQQFDIYLSYLYRFNMSSYTFESLANGSLFVFDQDEGVISTDGQNIYGKYKLLYKTANFFSNCFTWIIVAFCLVLLSVIIWGIRKYWKNRVKYDYKQQHPSQTSSANQNAGQNAVEIVSKGGGLVDKGTGDQYMAKMKQNFKLKKLERSTAQLEQKISYKVLNRFSSIFWLTFPIHFFYFSLIQLNVNIFTQIGNLTFSSAFAAAGAFFSAAFLALEAVLIFILFLKTREECIKPEWMRDFTYSPCFYLIRTNYKTVTKYFWFISCIKKIFFALFLTIFYSDPVAAIIAVSSVEALYILVAIYCQPYERRYLRIHFYLTQGFKLFMFVSLLNFSEKYKFDKQLIDITQIFYIVLALIFGSHFGWILINLLIEWKVYWYSIKTRLRQLSKCCKKQQTQGRMQQKSDNNESKSQNFEHSYEFKQKDIISDKNGLQKEAIKYPFSEAKVGYFCQGKMHLYDKI